MVNSLPTLGNYRRKISLTFFAAIGARTRDRRVHQFYVPPRYQLDYSAKNLDLFYDDHYRELVTNLPRLGVLPSSELSRLKGELQTLFPPDKNKKIF